MIILKLKYILFSLFIVFFVVPSTSFCGIIINKSSIVYIGAFRVPKGTYGGGTFSNNSFVNAQYQPLAFNPSNNSLFLGQSTGVETSPKRLGEISIPSTIINPKEVGYDVTQLTTASVLQNIADPSSGNFDKIKIDGTVPSDEAKAQLGGLYVYDGKLYGTVFSYYDSTGNNGHRSHWTANLDWSGGYGFNGIYAVGSSINPPMVGTGGFVGGYMVEVPDEYKSSVGYPLLTGRQGGPIVSRSSFGPSLWGFDPATFNSSSSATATPFITYTEAHSTLGGYGSTTGTMYLNMSTGIKGVIWPEGSSSILLFGQTGFGIEFDSNGIPLANSSGSCTGPGTSNRSEAKNNEWLAANSPSGWTCGYTSMSSGDISGGDSCCFDPTNPAETTHNLPYVVGSGESGYGPGTQDYTYARTNAWLVANSPGGYNCNGHTMSAADISAGQDCVFVGTGSTDKGGSSYPNTYQVWQYEVDDLLDVKNGIKQPYEIIPTIWNFDLPMDNPLKKKQILGVSFDETTKRLYVGQAFGDGNYPLIHVFEIPILNTLGLGNSVIKPSPFNLKITTN